MNECSVFLDASGLSFDVLKLLFLLNQSWLICKELADSLQAACPTRNSLFSNHLITSTSHQSQPLHHICSFNRVTCCFLMHLILWLFYFNSICLASTTVSHESGPLKNAATHVKGMRAMKWAAEVLNEQLHLLTCLPGEVILKECLWPGYQI